MRFFILFFAFVELILFSVTSVSSVTVSYVCYPENGLLIVDCLVKYEAKYGCSIHSYNYIRFVHCAMPNLPRKFFKDYTYRIKTVDISSLDGQTLANNLFSNLTYLEKLLANNNKLTTVPDKMLTNTNAHYLDLSHNRIARIETIGKCGANNLQTLLLASNNITTISGTTFNDLLQLTVLDLSFNRLQTLAPESFEQLINLKNLSLAYTNIHHFGFGMLAGCHQLESLNISGNHINKIDIGLDSTVFRYLKRIDVSVSEVIEFTGLEARIFPSLNYLNLRNNRINCSHLASILSPFDKMEFTFEMDPNARANGGMSFRGVSCGIGDDSLVMTTTEPIIPTTEEIHTTPDSGIAFDEAKQNFSMDLKNFQAVQQQMYQLMIVVLVLVVIIVTLIIMSIFGVHFERNRTHLFSPFRQNLFGRQIRHRLLKDDGIRESIAL